jgi:sugar phosphate isomerase/epimerase
MDRRHFLKNSTLALLASGCSKNIFNKYGLDKEIKPGLQLYTLRNEMQSDLEGTLRKVAEIGYTTLEHAGYDNGLFYGKKPTEFNKILINEGLSVVSGHLLTGRQNPSKKYTMINEFERVAEDMQAINQKFIVCAWLFPEERTCLDDYRKLTDILNKCGEICKKHGIVFAYHNHDFEFDPIQTLIPYNILLKETEPELVKFEMDMYWMTKAKQDPLKYFDLYPERFPLWHVKDMNKEDASKFAEVGKGSINFARLFAAKEKAGLRQYFVEQDDCYDQKPLDCIKTSIDYLKTKSWAK